MTLRLSQIRQWLGLPYGRSGLIARGYSIDSRTIQSGDLFFAIRGPCNDGHDYVQEAFRLGAVAAVVETSFQGAGDGVLLRVSETGEALRTVAAKARAAWGRTVVAITGSGGKTTTKDVTAALLGTSRPRFEIGGQPEQRVRPAAVAAEGFVRVPCSGGRDRNQPRGRDEPAGSGRRSGHRGRDQRGCRAPGELRFRRRDRNRKRQADRGARRRRHSGTECRRLASRRLPECAFRPYRHVRDRAAG